MPNLLSLASFKYPLIATDAIYVLGVIMVDYYFIVVDNDYSDPRKFEHLIEALTWFGREVSAVDFNDNLTKFVTNELVEINEKNYQLYTSEEFSDAVEDNE